MKVFLGWAGFRSKKTAETLGEWLKYVIQAVKPWISTGMLKGARWEEEIVKALEDTKVGILCLTRENLNENWILFEAGALSKTKDSLVCAFLLDDIPSTYIKPPLAMFQHTKFDKQDVRKLVHTINQAVRDTGEHSLDDAIIDRVFDLWWPVLEEKIKKIIGCKDLNQPIWEDQYLRILREILTVVRALATERVDGSIKWYEGSYAIGEDRAIHCLPLFKAIINHSLHDPIILSDLEGTGIRKKDILSALEEVEERILEKDVRKQWQKNTLKVLEKTVDVHSRLLGGFVAMDMY